MDDISELNKLWLSLEPDVVVFETFNLYPGAAAHLTHNEFYPCQIIGVIKTLCWINSTQFLVPQAPSIKKYSGGLDERWKIFSKEVGSEKSEQDVYKRQHNGYRRYTYGQVTDGPEVRKDFETRWIQQR